MTSRLLLSTHLFAFLKQNVCLTNIKRTFSIYPSRFNESKNDLDEADWFNKLTDKKNESTSGPKKAKNFKELNIEEKKKMIQELLSFRRENGLSAPKVVDEKGMEDLLKSESYTHLIKTIK